MVSGFVLSHLLPHKFGEQRGHSMVFGTHAYKNLALLGSRQNKREADSVCNRFYCGQSMAQRKARCAPACTAASHSRAALSRPTPPLLCRLRAMVGSLELPLIQPLGQGHQGFVPGTGERALDWLHTTRPPALYVRTAAHTRDLVALLVARQQDQAGADDGFHEGVAVIAALN